MDLVACHWPGKHHAVVRCIDLTTLLWSDGDRQIPSDYRLSDKSKDGLTMNDHFSASLNMDHDRGFVTACVAFDGGYSGFKNRKLIRR